MFIRILEDLYEAHGDTLALQYGGFFYHVIVCYKRPISVHMWWYIWYVPARDQSLQRIIFPATQ